MHTIWLWNNENCHEDLAFSLCVGTILAVCPFVDFDLKIFVHHEDSTRDSREQFLISVKKTVIEQNPKEPP